MVENLDKKKIVLPEFQRDFVWELSKTYDLFDSLVKDVFIGSLIYGIPSFEVTVREIDTRERKAKGKRRKRLALQSYSKAEIDKKIKTDSFRLLLDGQQRTTSIYRAFKGIDTVWFIARHDNEMPTFSNTNVGSRPVEDFLHEFSGKESADYLSIQIHDVYRMMEGEIQRERQKQEILSRSAYIEGRKADGTLSDTEFDNLFEKYLTITNKLQDLFKAEKLVSYYLLNTSAEKFALFFERSNSRGIQLNFIDILAAKLYVGFNLRERISMYESLHSYSLNRDIIVRAISFLVSDGTHVPEFADRTRDATSYYNAPQIHDHVCSRPGP